MWNSIIRKLFHRNIYEVDVEFLCGCESQR